MKILKQILFNKRRVIILTNVLLAIISLFFIRVAQLREQRRQLLSNLEDFDFDYDNVNKSEIDEEKLAALRKSVQIANARQKILNINRFGPLRKENCIIVIQVRAHSDRSQRDNFVHQLNFLSKVKGIHRTLLIFSHAHYEEETNNVIKDIHFARVLQIFYPYSIQLYPNVFPGNDFKFCKNNLKCETSNNLTLRNASYTELKHHWWWTVNEVFDNLWVTRKFDNQVVFLEEDDCVTEDFVYIILSLQEISQRRRKNCLFSLNSKIPTVNQYHVNASIVYFNVFRGEDHRTGLAFNRTTWNKIRKYSDHFCNFNDYSWQNSLEYLSLQTERNNFCVLFSEGPRILKVSDFGYGFINTFFKKIQNGLFPKTIDIQKVKNYDTIKYVNELKEQGQWEDRRDKELCTFVTNVKIIYDLTTAYTI